MEESYWDPVIHENGTRYEGCIKQEAAFSAALLLVLIESRIVVQQLIYD